MRSNKVLGPDIQKYVCTKNYVNRSKLGVRIVHADSHFCSCDLDPDLMTFICERDLHILKVYITTMNFLGQSFQKLEHYRQTDRHY